MLSSLLPTGMVLEKKILLNSLNYFCEVPHIHIDCLDFSVLNLEHDDQFYSGPFVLHMQFK